MDNRVLTNPVNTWGGLMQQKIRWASKWRQHKEWVTWVLALFVFIVNAVFISIIALGFSGDISLTEALGLYGVKILIDVVFIKKTLQWYGEKMPIWLISLLSIVYPIYALYIGVISSFGNYQWKGRNY